MYARTNSVTQTVHRESFAFPSVSARSTEPEVFTFDQIPVHASAVRSFVPIRPKKRCVRVMYPAKVRMHLPPPEKSKAKRWLVVLCLVVMWQIYTEEPCAEAPLSSAESSMGSYHGFPFQSAEELAAIGTGSDLLSAALSTCEDRRSSSDQVIPKTTCSKPGENADTARSFEQSASNSYMVALLVYHRLGSDK
ncbi:Radiation-inducible immediate-early gene IEX-1 [Channa argus]|uniref:Radiation-inducible immediate-early gene IEX-1 n=1 Tax=Channa argus TaxID=215402 RepID=A0A6G1PYG6_CHAAH|nr:Radiation-inducible immediate-early gene IEX-1 [Channa argus]KAK2901616.1 hypothetical protein Q8A73_011362 [Channa argus]